MKIDNEIKLDFKDVLFRPKRSTLSSRSEVDVEIEYTFKHSGMKWKGVPIISSNMDTVSSVAMFKELSQFKCITCFHKYINIDEVISVCKEGYSSDYFMLSTGITDNDYINSFSFNSTSRELEVFLKNSENQISLTVYDISGKRILNETHFGIDLIKTSFPNLKSGVYIINLQKRGTNTSLKVVVL